MALIWFNIAKTDLEAATYLLDKKLYPHSVFFLQQSIEKLLKSLGIWTSIIDAAEAKDDIGHVAHKIHAKFLENFSKIEIPDATISMLEKITWGRGHIERVKLIAGQLGELIPKIQSKEVRELSISSYDFLSRILLDIQSDMQEMKKEIVEWRQQFEKLDEKQAVEFAKHLLVSVGLLLPRESAEASKKAFDRMPPDTIRDVLKKSQESSLIPRREFDFCWGSLLSLSMVFSAHEASARYPDVDFNPLEVYVEKTRLIQMLGSFIEITKEICTLLEDVYLRMEPLDFGKARKLSGQR